MASHLSKTAGVAAWIERINELWRLHEPENEHADSPGPCQFFVVDRRYVKGRNELEWRLGVSFGGDPVLPTRPRGLASPPILPGKFIFGIHLVGILGNQISLFDEWVDDRQASNRLATEEAFEMAKTILRDMSDREYAGRVSENPHNPEPLRLSDRWLIEDFEVLRGFRT
jgi:hypothetical protein